MDHTLYLPDLPLSDLYLFDYIKERLITQTDEKSLTGRITKIFSPVPKKEFTKTLDMQLRRIGLGILNKGITLIIQ